MSNKTPVTAKRRLDYQPPAYQIHDIELSFNLDDEVTKVKSLLHVFKQGDHDQPLKLDGENLTLIEVKLNGKSLQQYELTDEALTLSNLPDECFIEIYTEIDPASNKTLEGLYKASGSYCTQCEAEGFRKITYFLDRPDVLSKYTVTIYADKKRYPYLLSNGNKIDSGDLEDGKHWVKWQDPFFKPCYLFALVAGDFDKLTQSFTTSSGRKVALELYVDKGMAHRGEHALASLKKAMKWDEVVFDLEYDLDIYMVVAVDFFNMGAMENKGLNVFNSKYVLADSQTATDEDYFNIESVIAHEYFHNWTGNRVTCRDWFQLSLKEGLTVFRDQQFSADMGSPVVNRIKNVKVIREHQFAEDASAMAHPIRPDEVIEMNNFYTVTVYDKGAEVIRMLHTLLTPAGFKRGIDLYFKRHDGQAVTCDDFVNAMQDANSINLDQFKVWYEQSGTPELTVEQDFAADTGTLTLTIQQHTPVTLDQSQKKPLYIPVRVEYLANDGSSTTDIIHLTQSQQKLVRDGFDVEPTVALLGDFSAPVKVIRTLSAESLLTIALHSNDGFSRWDAAQTIYSQFIHSLTPNGSTLAITQETITALLDGLLESAMEDQALLAEMITLPSVETLVQQVPKYYVESLHSAREKLERIIISHAQPMFEKQYHGLAFTNYDYTPSQTATRKLRNQLLMYIASTEQGEELVTQQFMQSDNMTDTLGALKAAQHAKCKCFDKLMSQFEETWRADPIVLDKWFALHASRQSEDILSRLDLLMGHQQFNHENPNRVRSVIGSFAFFNSTGFHAKDGSGYRYIGQYLQKLDKINPQVASRIVTPLTQWQKLDEERIVKMKAELVRLLDNKDLSNDVYEKVSKSLGYQ
ncbi:aminopeptidase N [Aliiglaciecola litoralis]|uniref:Aminopeptidase N n=1 Tax=Aliiglaciecola litoralis TaxID=582857 RepID=A0ABP3WP72_9ALTE